MTYYSHLVLCATEFLSNYLVANNFLSRKYCGHKKKQFLVLKRTGQSYCHLTVLNCWFFMNFMCHKNIQFLVFDGM